MRLIVPVAWACWAILLGALLVLAALDARTGRTPEVGAGAGVAALGAGFALLIGVGALLYWFASRQSTAGVVGVAVVLGWSTIVLVAGPVQGAFESWQYDRDQARVGDFLVPALQPMAGAIEARDCATLTSLLAGQPAPAGEDRAGHDLLAYAVLAVRDREGDPACVRAILESGASPDATRMPGGSDLLNYLIIDGRPPARETLLLLLAHGADPNALDPSTGAAPLRSAGASLEVVRALVEAGADVDYVPPSGTPALLGFVAQQHWEAAVYLVEEGADIEWSRDGLSLDYYLRSWKDGVYGAQPEGWDELREALAVRGKTIPR